MDDSLSLMTLYEGSVSDREIRVIGVVRNCFKIYAVGTKNGFSDIFECLLADDTLQMVHVSFWGISGTKLACSLHQGTLLYFRSLKFTKLGKVVNEIDRLSSFKATADASEVKILCSTDGAYTFDHLRYPKISQRLQEIKSSPSILRFLMELIPWYGSNI